MEIMYKNSIDIFISSARIVWLDSRRKDTEMTLTNGEWRTEAYLPQGRYLYRLVINNQIWINDHAVEFIRRQIVDFMGKL